MPSQRAQLGNRGEQLAEDYLRTRGLRIIGRNFRTPWGELDLIAQDKNEIVFCEVKASRGPTPLPFPLEQKITPAKHRRLQKAIIVYLNRHDLALDIPWRLDIITIIFKSRSEPPLLKHITAVSYYS